ncbi:cell cycle serine/threonine-protein kinase CDC5/MSD2 [Aplysia californica]|uniref:Cell cycle serine/threonine-protein kinase CDC5/MSD2 n=1 Tax=Aplysia californica TaxID=6500 RepID=A0ABM0JL18_APLCA|nr:cell cycle serine/threonine-protein kinase CDC5/MSD2 [Aplysia californica]
MSTMMNLPPEVYETYSVSATEALGLKEDTEIAKGGSCQVVVATDVNDPGKKKALKRLMFLEGERNYRKKHFYFCNEIRFLQNVQHPNIIQVDKALSCPGEFVIAMEYHPTDLFEAMTCLTDAEVTKYFTQVVDALLYLHDRHIVHGDVKLENVLIDMQGNAKLCDFGHAQLIPNKSCKRWGGTPEYHAPEYSKGQPVEDAFKLESFSLGVFVCALSLYEYPVKDLDYLELLRGAESVPDIHRVCAERLLCPSPAERASISEIHQRLNDHRRPENHTLRDVIDESPAPVSAPKRRKCSHIKEEYRNLHSRGKVLKKLKTKIVC